MDRLYLDHAAGTPVDPQAARVLQEVLAEGGNPASPHAEGRRAKDRLEASRDRAAQVLGCRPREIVFTASATVACQLAVLGAARAAQGQRRIVVSGVEHPAVSDAAETLAAEGCEILRVAPDTEGVVQADAFLDAVGSKAVLAALMLGSHETGALQPVHEVGQELRARGVPFLTDACLGPGRVATTTDRLPADFVALSAPKFGGPAGAGLLVVRRGSRLAPLWRGGRQEERLHPGLENVAAVAAAACALERAVVATAVQAERYAGLVRTLLADLAPVRGWCIAGPGPERSLPGVLTLELPGIEGEAAMIHLDLAGIAVATGSTCALGATQPSAGLLAMGMSRRRAASTVRISVGPDTTHGDMHRLADALARTLETLHRLSGGGRR